MPFHTVHGVLKARILMCLTIPFSSGPHFVHSIVNQNIVNQLSVPFSHSGMSDSLWSNGLLDARLPCPLPSPGACSNSCPLSWWCHPTISSSVVPLSSYLSQHQGLFKWVNSWHQVAKVLVFQPQCPSLQWIFRTDFLLDEQVESSCCPRDSQESSPTPQFKGLNSSVLSFLYSPALTFIHD